MSQKMANGSSRNKNKAFDSRIGHDGSEVDPSYKMFLEHLSEDVSEADPSYKKKLEHLSEDVSEADPSYKMFLEHLSEDVSEVDPSYKMFLEHLSEDGNSYELYVTDGDHGRPASVRYEEDDDISCVGAMDKDCTNVLNRSIYRNPCGPNTKRPGVISGKDAHLNVEEMNTSIDESYAAFLSLMKIEDGFMVVEPEPGVTIVYEQEDETPAGFDEMRILRSTKDRKHSMNVLENVTEDRLKTGNIISERGTNGPAPDSFHSEDLICTDEHGRVPFTESSDFNVCEDDQGVPLAFSSGVPSTFDEKLDSVLSRSYDRGEYEELLTKATDRKPVSRQRHLRSASKPYATDITGLSYLDHYPELAKQIYSADTDERRLNLLRKLFFWLENLSHEGAHMPWVSSKGLACDPILADN